MRKRIHISVGHESYEQNTLYIYLKLAQTNDAVADKAFVAYVYVLLEAHWALR